MGNCRIKPDTVCLIKTRFLHITIWNLPGRCQYEELPFNGNSNLIFVHANPPAGFWCNKLETNSCCQGAWPFSRTPLLGILQVVLVLDNINVNLFQWACFSHHKKRTN